MEQVSRLLDLAAAIEVALAALIEGGDLGPCHYHHLVHIDSAEKVQIVAGKTS